MPVWQDIWFLSIFLAWLRLGGGGTIAYLVECLCGRIMFYRSSYQGYACVMEGQLLIQWDNVAVRKQWLEALFLAEKGGHGSAKGKRSPYQWRLAQILTPSGIDAETDLSHAFFRPRLVPPGRRWPPSSSWDPLGSKWSKITCRCKGLDDWLKISFSFFWLNDLSKPKFCFSLIVRSAQNPGLIFPLRWPSCNDEKCRFQFFWVNGNPWLYPNGEPIRAGHWPHSVMNWRI